MSFEERFSNLFSRGSAKAQQAVKAAAGQDMPPSGGANGNRLTNFLAFPPGTDPSVNATGMVQRGVYRVPMLNSVLNNNSPLSPISAKPSGSAARVSYVPASTQPLTRGAGQGATSPSWRERAGMQVNAARERVRNALR